MTDTNAIDRAINEAKARKAAKAGNPEGNSIKDPKPAKEPKAPKATDAEKEIAKANRVAERAAAKVERDAARATKRAAKQADKKPAHMSKVEKAASKLPNLNEASQVKFNDIVANFSRDQVNAISLHLQHFNRVKATERALNQKVVAGSTVTILSGDPRYVGMTGTVTKAQRIRCYVDVGAKKPIYCFTGDVEVTAEQVKTGTEG